MNRRLLSFSVGLVLLAPSLALGAAPDTRAAKFATVLLVDKSRSMNEAGRLDYAKSVIRQITASVAEGDFLGVTAYDSLPFILSGLTKVDPEFRTRTWERTDRLFPAGRTNFLPALDEAFRALKRVEAQNKRIVVITDMPSELGSPFVSVLFHAAPEVKLSVVVVPTSLSPKIETERVLDEMGKDAVQSNQDSAEFAKKAAACAGTCSKAPAKNSFSGFYQLTMERSPERMKKTKCDTDLLKAAIPEKFLGSTPNQWVKGVVSEGTLIAPLELGTAESESILAVLPSGAFGAIRVSDLVPASPQEVAEALAKVSKDAESSQP